MEPLNISNYPNGISKEIVIQEFTNNSGVVLVDYVMSSINSSNSYLDIIQDYLDASFVAEELGKSSSFVNAKEISRYPYSPLCRYEFSVSDIDAFAKRLNELSLVFSKEPSDDILEKYQDEMAAYEASLDDRLFLCPELIDGYYANLIEGAYIELGSELGKGYLKKEYKKYPERRFGFWKSAYSKTAGQMIYVSRECWILPNKSDFQKILVEQLGFPEFEIYDEAHRFNWNGTDYFAGKHAVVLLPVNAILQAQRFVRYFLLKQKPNAFTAYNFLPEPKHLLSHSGYSMMIDDGMYVYLFFPESLRENRIHDLYKETAVLFESLANLSGVSKEIKLSWAGFDDEKFESLCYDIIYHSPQFDNTTIRKMGKSRSRDGGRDITVYTNERPGKAKKLYILQCKFTKVGSSLTTQKVENISDTVMQYGAQGYGVMSPVVIDATLYDRIDDICEKFKIESRNWSIFEIERFIAGHPALKQRYFD